MKYTFDTSNRSQLQQDLHKVLMTNERADGDGANKRAYRFGLLRPIRR